MAFLRAAAFVLFLASALLLVVPVQWLARRRRWLLQNRIQTGFCKTICAILGVEVVAHGELSGRAPRLFVANHVSWTDIIVLSSLHPLVFLAKSEVARWPILGFLARLQGTIFVERENRRDVARVNRRVTEVLRAGCDVAVFPEGTSSDGSAVLRFHAAHFGPLYPIAGEDSQRDAPALVPVAIVYTERGADASGGRIDVGWYGDMTFVPHLWSLMTRGGVACHVFFGEAIAPANGDRKALANAAEASVRALLTGARAERKEPVVAR